MAEVARVAGPQRGSLGGGSFLTFRVDSQLYALPADEITEVVRLPAVARLPQSPPGLLGMANLRGTVLPVASLRGLLGRGAAMAGPAADNAARAIVLDGAAPIALVVDAVDTLVVPDAAVIETAPAALAAEPGEMLRAAFPAPSGIAKVLDIRLLLDRALARPAKATASPRAGIGRVGARPSAVRADTDGRPLLTFEVAGQEYALDLGRVQAIVAPPEGLALVPRADGAVLGLAAARDALLPVLSLRALLGLAPAAGLAGTEKVIIATIAGMSVGLMADRVRAVLRADAATIEPAPPLLAARAGGEARLAAIHRRPGNARPLPILAPDQLFRDDIMQRLGEHRAGTDGGATPTGIDEKTFLIFRLGPEEFGLPIAAVVEVAGAPEQVTRIPKAPKFLEGVVNLRGEVLPVIDQRRRFDLGPAPDRQRQRLIVLRTGRYRAALIVDGVREVRRVAADAIGPGPDIARETTRLVSGVANLEAEGRLVLLLDPEELLTRTEQRLLDNFAAIRPAP